METTTGEAAQQIHVISDDEHGNHLILTGPFDAYMAQDLRRCALDLLASGQDVAVDLTDVESIDVSGIQVLLALGRDLSTRGKKLVVSGTGPNANRCFRLAGIAGLLPVS